MPSLLLPEECQERCARKLRGMVDWGTVEVNRCPHGEWRVLLKGQAMPSHPSFSLSELDWRSHFPRRVKLKRCWGISKLAKKKKKKSHHQPSSLIDWWVVLSSNSLFWALNPEMGLKARDAYRKFTYLWAGGTNKHHCVFRDRRHRHAWILTTSVTAELNFHKLWLRKLSLIL